jgi:hypothetical protein
MGGILDWLGGLGSWLTGAWQWIKQEISAVADWAHRAFVSLGDWIKRWPLDLLKAVKWLTHLRLSDVWAWLKRMHKHLTDFEAWYKKYVSGPIDAQRRKILALYDQFFRPIVGTIDTFRKLTRIVAIFDKKLAAKIDQRLMALEGWFLAPITDALKRLNQLSSWARAITTELGYFDRTTELESLRRDCKQVWQVLTNPRGIFPTQPIPFTASDPKAPVINLLDYLQSKSGPYVDSTDTAVQTYTVSVADFGG